MRVLICGGRDFYDWQYFAFKMELFNQRMFNANIFYNNFSVKHNSIGVVKTVIQGHANGADKMARVWAKIRGLECISYPADWDTHGKRAGYIRNKQMLDEGKPFVIVAFPGGRGTEMMIKLSDKYNIPAVNLEEDYDKWLKERAAVNPVVETAASVWGGR